MTKTTTQVFDKAFDAVEKCLRIQMDVQDWSELKKVQAILIEVSRSVERKHAKMEA